MFELLVVSIATVLANWETQISMNYPSTSYRFGSFQKVLNDDDALDLFKKTIPSASSSFVQMTVSSNAMRSNALAAIAAVQKASLNKPKLDIIMLALSGKKIGFDKVIKMIDEMVVTLKTEQQDDDNKKEYCAAQFDITEDKKKALERLISDKETAIATAKEAIATLSEEIKRNMAVVFSTSK